MAPVLAREPECYTQYNNKTIDRDISGGLSETNNQEDTHAVLYIVCTLLFYSLGIIVGIVTYLKKEKQEIEENRMFDEFINFRKGQPLSNDRHIKVLEVVKKLQELEKAKLSQTSDSCSFITTHSYPGSISPKNSQFENFIMEQDCKTVDETNSVTIDTELTQSGGSDVYNCDDPFQNRRLSQVVAQILDSDSTIGEGADYDETVSDYENTESEIETDFIDYKEEPKNKELFRDAFKDATNITTCFSDYNSSFDMKTRALDCIPEMSHESSTDFSEIIEGLDNENESSISGGEVPECEGMQDTENERFCDNVRTLITKHGDVETSETVFGVHIANDDQKCTQTNFSEEHARKSGDSDGPPFRWSVTSV